MITTMKINNTIMINHNDDDNNDIFQWWECSYCQSLQAFWFVSWLIVLEMI